MTDNNDFFPFPASPDEPEKPSSNNSALPAFPETSVSPVQALKDSNTMPLDASEIHDLRQILELYRGGNLGASQVAKTVETEGSVNNKPVVNSAPAVAAAPAANLDLLRQEVSQAFEAIFCPEPVENENKVIFKGILNEITDGKMQLRVFASLAGLFPIKKSLRHGTPEQRLFTLIALGDRFLQSLSGLAFVERKKIIKAVARFLSQVAENYNFIQMEGEAFASQYHERVAGASTAGKLVREMHGFLVVGKDNNQVVRVGMVLT